VISIGLGVATDAVAVGEAILAGDFARAIDAGFAARAGDPAVSAVISVAGGVAAGAGTIF
jgi:hypothetical protein